MAKKSGKAGVDLKQFFVQKGERVGFYAAGGLLLLFLALGGYVASTSASSGAITTDIASKISATETKINKTGDKPTDLDPVVRVDPTLPAIKFTEYPAPNEFWNTAVDETPKRVSPIILKLTEAQVEFDRGSIGAYDIIDDGNDRMIAAVVTKEKTQNNAKMIKDLQKRNTKRKTLPPGTQGAPGVVPGAPGAVAGVPGVPGGVPGIPGAAGFPGGIGGGNKFLGGAAGGGMVGNLAGGLAGFNLRSQDTEVQYVKIDSKDLDQAKLAETLLPKRMVIVTGSIPYAKQVEEYRRALRAQTVQELSSNDLPWYHSYNVERQVWTPDGKTLLQDWEKLDVEGTLGELYAKVIEFEPELPPKDLDPTLAPYFDRLIPESQHRLLVPRPKLRRGQYEVVNLPSVPVALKALKDLGGNIGELKTATRQQLEMTDPFAVGARQQPNRPDGVTGVGPGVGPGAGTGLRPPGGGGFPPGGIGSIPGLPNITIGPDGRINGLPPGFKPPPSMLPPGVTIGPDGKVNLPPGMDPNMLSSGLNPSQQSVPEETWLMRFIDVTTEPGYAYKYRVQLKAFNPNYNRPEKDLATPTLAKIEDLKSDWFVVPQLVQVPREEFLYAAARDEKKNKVTEKMPSPANWDETWVQLQRWYAFIRPDEFNRPEPLGEWLVAELKALRGQYVGEKVPVTLPVWKMDVSAFLFRENVKKQSPRGPLGSSRPKPEPVWTVDLTPTPPLLLVDFEGGEGQYPVPRRGGTGAVRDTAEVEMLFLTSDGKLKVARSSQDTTDEQRTKREDDWKAWLQKVQQDTIAAKLQGLNLNGPGGGPAGSRTRD
jgi:hypothetical protein